MCIAPEAEFRQLLQDIRTLDLTAQRTFIVQAANDGTEPKAVIERLEGLRILDQCLTIDRRQMIV